jgi:hypothetical protein
MPPSPTDIQSVITVENTDGIISLVMFSREFFLSRFAVCKTIGVLSVVGFFYISDRISDGMKNYRRSVFRRKDSVDEAVGKKVTDGLHALHRRN